VRINRPLEEVYTWWRDFENLPTFMRHLESVDVLDARRSHWKVKAPAGMTVEWEAEIVEDEPNRLIAWRSLPGADVENSGIVRFEAAPVGHGTQVTVSLRYEPPGGVVGRAFAKLFGEEPEQQVREDLRALRQVLETGEVTWSDALAAKVHPGQPPKQKIGKHGKRPDGVASGSFTSQLEGGR
jgi:uncharacterized membrane protein